MEIELKLLPSSLAHKVRSYTGGEVGGRYVQQRFTDVSEDRRIGNVAVICSEVECQLFEPDLYAILLPDGDEGHRLVERAVLKMQAFKNQLSEDKIVNARNREIMDTRLLWQWKIVNVFAKGRQDVASDRVEKVLVEEQSHRLVILSHAVCRFRVHVNCTCVGK